jgi:hypothetical protein
MKKIYIIAIQIISIAALIFFVNGVMAQSKARVENVDFNLVDENLVITYDIAKSKSGETFTVSVKILTTSGKNISAFALSGDVGPGVSGGVGKQITWDLNKDNVYIDDEISVEVLIDEDLASPMGTPDKTAKPAEHVSVGGAMLRSLIFPGWGNRKVKGKGAYWLMGVAGYGAIGASIFFNNQADQTYQDYQNSLDAAERDQLFSDAEGYKQNQDIMMYTAAGIWVIDLIWTGVQAGNANKKLSKVDVGYYYNPVVKKPMVTLTYKF